MMGTSSFYETTKFPPQPSTIVAQWTTGTTAPAFPNMMGNASSEQSYGEGYRFSNQALQVPQPFPKPFPGAAGWTAPIGVPVFLRPSLNVAWWSTGIGAQANTNLMATPIEQQFEYETAYSSPGQTQTFSPAPETHPSMEFTQSTNSMSATDTPQCVNSPSLEQPQYPPYYSSRTSAYPPIFLEPQTGIAPLTTIVEGLTYLSTTGSRFEQANHAFQSQSSMTSASLPSGPTPLYRKFGRFVSSDNTGTSAPAKRQRRKSTTILKPKNVRRRKVASTSNPRNVRRRKVASASNPKNVRKRKAVILTAQGSERKRTHPCKLCEWVCYNSHDLLRHTETHKKQKTHICTLGACGRRPEHKLARFARTDSLKRHLKGHTPLEIQTHREVDGSLNRLLKDL